MHFVNSRTRLYENNKKHTRPVVVIYYTMYGCTLIRVQQITQFTIVCARIAYADDEVPAGQNDPSVAKSELLAAFHPVDAHRLHRVDVAVECDPLWITSKIPPLAKTPSIEPITKTPPDQNTS